MRFGIVHVPSIALLYVNANWIDELIQTPPNLQDTDFIINDFTQFHIKVMHFIVYD